MKLVEIYRWKDTIKGGRADNKSPEDFDKKQLQKGIKHEVEHTSDVNKAKEIAMDHLVDDPKYYDKLDKIENEAAINELPFGKPKLQQKTGSQQQHKSSTEFETKLLSAVKKHLGDTTEPGKALGLVALDLADILSRIPDKNYVEKILTAWERVVAYAKIFKTGQAEAIDRFIESVDRLVCEALGKQRSLNAWVDAFAEKLVNIPNENQAKITLRSLVQYLPQQTDTEKKKKAGKKTQSKKAGDKSVQAATEPKSVEPKQSPSAIQEPAAPIKQATQEPVTTAKQAVQEPDEKLPSHKSVAKGYGETGKGGDQTKIRDSLLKPLKLNKLDLSSGSGVFARDMARAANVLAAHIAHHPASSPKKAKDLISKWSDLVSLVGTYMQKKPGFFKRMAQKKARAVK